METCDDIYKVLLVDTFQQHWFVLEESGCGWVSLDSSTPLGNSSEEGYILSFSADTVLSIFCVLKFQ